MKTATARALIACAILMAAPADAQDVGFHFGSGQQKRAINTGIQACMDQPAPKDVPSASKRRYCTCVVNHIASSFSTEIMELALTMSVLTKEDVKKDKTFRRLSAKFSRRCIQ